MAIRWRALVLCGALLWSACGPFEPLRSNPGYCNCDGGTSSSCETCAADHDMAHDLGDMAQATLCQTNADCTAHAGAPVCDTATGACVACVASSDCTTPAAPVCTPSDSCGACMTNTDCGRFSSTPVCDTASGACVQCTTASDCDALHEACNTTTHVCGVCTSNADCTSGLCCGADGTLPGGGACTVGQCIAESTLFYVDNSSASCSDTGGCSFLAPCCTMQMGLNKSAGSGMSPPRPVVVFPGNTYAEALTASPTKNGGGAYVATAVGVNAPAIRPASGTILTLSGASSGAVNVDVTLDGFTFDGSTATNGIVCAGDATGYADTALTLLRSAVSNGAAGVVGVTTSGACTLTMDQDVISNNKGGGLSLAATDFTLTNLLVSDNGSSTSALGGISLGSAGESGKMSVVDVTVVDNQKTTGIVPSGIFCNSAAVAILNTVVFGNSGSSQLDATSDCMSTSYSAFPSATGTGNVDVTTCTAAQLFSGSAPTPFMPIKGTGSCNLVDVGTNSGAPDHDLVGTKRPQPSPNGVDDIGCYELPQ